MFSRCFWPLFAGAFFLASTLAGAAPQYPPSAASTRTTVIVHIIWHKDFKEVDAACNALNNQPPSTGDTTILGCYFPPTQTIYAVEPISFNDEFHLMILGHEFWHALGAKHPE